NNGTRDIFIKDLETGEVTRLSVDAKDGEANNDSYAPVFSPDGTKIAFTSLATNLIVNDTNDVGDIFIKDLLTGEVTRISTNSKGEELNASSESLVFSPDGKKVAFISSANNAVDNDTNFNVDIFVKDLETGELIRVSTTSAGQEANASSYAPVFSPDGSQILFQSYAYNLVNNDTNDVGDIFIKDLTTGNVTLVSQSTTGVQANAFSQQASFSADGSQVVYASLANNLVENDKNSFEDVVVATLGVGGGTDTVQSSVSYTLANNVENLILLGKDSLTGAGNELDNIITGTEAGDFIYGYAGNDTLSGALGDDNIEGGVGDDLVFGDDGNDYLVGGEGNDTLVGGNGNDNLSGGAGNNSYIYTNGHDFINNEEYPSADEDNGIGDLLTIANFARSQAVFSQDIQIA
ncbi:MAG TPA: DPP IV N-terminal domain-containing protein, partial [Agitococcus sp.]|nr:DPP IV N-terminal domain-containing protein [Agitococcus sp.]